jgi:hypothetical protein
MQSPHLSSIAHMGFILSDTHRPSIVRLKGFVALSAPFALHSHETDPSDWRLWRDLRRFTHDGLLGLIDHRKLHHPEGKTCVEEFLPRHIQQRIMPHSLRTKTPAAMRLRCSRASSNPLTTSGYWNGCRKIAIIHPITTLHLIASRLQPISPRDTDSVAG